MCNGVNPDYRRDKENSERRRRRTSIVRSMNGKQMHANGDNYAGVCMVLLGPARKRGLIALAMGS